MSSRTVVGCSSIPINIVPMEGKHLNWVRSTFKRSLRSACGSITSTDMYYDIFNPGIDELTERLITNGIVATYKHIGDEYLGWVIVTPGGSTPSRVVYCYTAHDIREKGICTALLKHANIPFEAQTCFRTNIWQSITQKKKEQSSQNTSAENQAKYRQ